MSDLVIRRLLIDLETPVARHWFGNDAFRTALFNALSMSFPFGEQFFIDSVRRGLKALPSELQEKFAKETQGFIGQEATHRRIHALFNAQIEKHGLVNDWEPRSEKRMALINSLDARHWLAVTAATEHFTAVFADWLLSQRDLFEGTEDRLKTLWLWHSSEESEHKCTAFDLYQALGGSTRWRVKWFNRITLIFFSDLMRQTANNLQRDGTLWQWQTWKSAASFLLGKNGMVRQMVSPLLAYRRDDFHPNQLSSPLSEQWLAENSARYSVVGERAPNPV